MGRTVVVIGRGYGGAAVAKALESEADVVLIDPRDPFVNTAGSSRALTQPDWAGNMFFPSGRIGTGRGADLFTGRFTEQFGPTAA